MGRTVEDKIEIEPFAMAASKDNDPCHLVRDGGSRPIAHLSAGLRAPSNNRSIYISPKDLITFASN